MAKSRTKKGEASIGPIKFLDIHIFNAPPKRAVTQRPNNEPGELIIMLNGTYRAHYEVEGAPQQLDAKAGDVICWADGLGRMEERDTLHPTKSMAIYFKGPKLIREFPRVVRDHHGVIRMLAERLLQAHVSPLRIPWFAKDAYLVGILAEYRHLSAALLENTLVAQVARYTEDHLAESFQLTDLARHIGFEKRHFSRKFKSQTHQTPMNYVRHQKALRALGILQINPKRSLHQIAPYIGVSDELQVRRLLQKYCGVSIRDLRKLESAPLDDRLSSETQAS